MKLFLREQRPLIIIYVVQLTVVTFVYWLDGYRNTAVSLYAVLLSSCLLAGYLLFRYMTHRSFYRRLEQPAASIGDFTDVKPVSPLSEGLHRLLKSQYRHYLSELNEQTEKIESHIHFINQWVHQMKTPISVIHLMIQQESNPRSVAIADELDRLRKGLDIVLYTARLDRFEHDIHVETLELEAVVRRVTSAQKRLFIRGKVFPVIDLEPQLSVVSDEKWLDFVLAQLITNAVRYTTKENGKLYFRADQVDGRTILEIEDEGIGIPDSDLPRVFDAYFTGENGRKFQESTGMGMYLVKEICHKLGHEIELESVEGKGTAVRILF